MTDASRGRSPGGSNPQGGGNKKPKKGWASVVSNLMGIAFKWLTDLLFLIQKLLSHCVKAFLTAVMLTIKLIVNADSHVLAWVAVFGIVMMITTIQWFRVGTWFLGIFGIVQAFGIPAGMLGVWNLYESLPSYPNAL